MNLSTLSGNIQQDVQLYAAKGLLSCHHYKSIYVDDLANTIAMSFYLGAASAVAYVAGMHVFTPLSIITLGITAIYVSIMFYRIFFLKIDQAKVWEPIFQNILDANYSAALEKLDALLAQKSMSNKNYSFKVLEPTSFDSGYDKEIKINYLRASLTTLKALVEISSNGIKNENEVTELFEKLDSITDGNKGKFVNFCKQQLTDHNDNSNRFKFIPTKAITSAKILVLNDFIETIQKIGKASTGECTQSIEKPIRYLREIRRFQRSDNHTSYITKMIDSKNFSDLLIRINDRPKTFDELLNDHLQSTKYANKTFDFEDDGEIYTVRIICNPEKKSLGFSPNGSGIISSKDSYLIACDQSLPESILSKFEKIKYSLLIGKMNGVSCLTYTASPTFA